MICSKLRRLHVIGPWFYLWCFKLLQKNTKAPQAAGKIHTDIEKGFIMAEIMKFDDYKEHGSETAVKVGILLWSGCNFLQISLVYTLKVKKTEKQ